MARDKRSRRPPEAVTGESVSKDTPVDPDVARFAERTFQQRAAEQDRKRADREARRLEEEHEQLIGVKDAAAGEVKRLRTRDHVTASQAEDAETAYRKALADLIAFETGTAPVWAASAGTDAAEPPQGDDEAEPQQAG